MALAPRDDSDSWKVNYVIAVLVADEIQEARYPIRDMQETEYGHCASSFAHIIAY